MFEERGDKKSEGFEGGSRGTALGGKIKEMVGGWGTTV